LALQKK